MVSNFNNSLTLGVNHTHGADWLMAGKSPALNEPPLFLLRQETALTCGRLSTSPGCRAEMSNIRPGGQNWTLKDSIWPAGLLKKMWRAKDLDCT